MAKDKTKNERPGGSMRGVYVAFVGCCAALALVPFVGMAWAPTTATTENRELAEAPSLVEDGAPNWGILADLGAYFEDHFAYRNELVSANAELRSNLLGVSPTDSVVVGTDGWLYYGGTLSDFGGWDVLSGRAIDNIAFNLSLMQGYCEAQGATFSVAIAPNKNTLYPEHMPYYYLPGQQKNLDNLEAAMDAYGINHADLQSVFKAQDETLYYLRDSHWNTKGALLASEAVMESLGKDPSSLDGLQPVEVDDYIGDLNSMLYPTTAQPEADYSYADGLNWSFAEGGSVEDSWIMTEGAGEGTLLMYRDSFDNNALQFFAASYEDAMFSKMVPYDLTQVGRYGVNDVVIERAERHIADLGTDPAIMAAPSVRLSIPKGGETLTDEGVSVSQDGSYMVVSGALPQGAADEGADIYIGLESGEGVQWYVPFRISAGDSDYGYKAYFNGETFAEVEKIWVACGSDGTLRCVQTLDNQG